MKYEENKKLIEAANLLKDYCRMNLKYGKNFKCNGCDCPFAIGDYICAIGGPSPNSWVVPKLTRWTPEDIALAKALKSVGAKVIYNTLGSVYWRTDYVHTFGKLPNGAFESIKDSESLSIEDIIKEAEG